MKKLFFVLLYVLISFAPFADAVDIQISDNPNRPDTSGPCVFIDGNGNFVSATNVMSLSTPAENNNAMLKCKGTVAQPANKAAVVYNQNFPGFELTECVIYQDGVFIGSTPNWQETVSASGKATLTCHYKLW